jgi:hypothetical protein
LNYQLIKNYKLFERMPEIDVTAFYKLSNEEKESQLLEELERLKGEQVNEATI